jgi:hypothetical protein
MEDISMFVEYHNTKQQFISSGLESVYFDKIVFIQEDNCIYTRGIYYSTIKEFLSKTPYVKGIGINNKFYNSADGGGYIHLASSSPTILNLNTAKNIVELSLDEEFVKEAKKAIYTIEPSVTGIHLNNRGKLNTYSLDVWVNIDGKEHITVTDQAYLEELNLSVWFSIDDDSIRHKLIIGGSYVIETEEGEAIIVAEDEEDNNEDNLIITLESESIDISKINDKINLYLIKEANSEGYGEELNKIYIPVTKDGGPLKAITEINPSNINKYISTDSIIDINKCSPYIHFTGSFAKDISLVLPNFNNSSDYFNVRVNIGSIICIYNNADNIISVSGTKNNLDIDKNQFGCFECKCIITNGIEDIYWESCVGNMHT